MTKMKKLNKNKQRNQTKKLAGIFLDYISALVYVTHTTIVSSADSWPLSQVIKLDCPWYGSPCRVG